MSEERRQVLELLASGTITAEQAERLLDKLASAQTKEASASKPGEAKARPRFLCVVVDGVGGDKVNVRVPLALVRTGIKLAAVLPEGAQARLSEAGLDLGKLSELDADQLVEALRDLQVDVDSETGDTVRVCCE